MNDNDDAGRKICGFSLATAPANAAKANKASANLWQRRLVPLLLRAFAERKDAAVKELAEKVGMASPNYVATVLGHGRGGLKMWKRGTAIWACQQNVAIAINFLHGDLRPDDQAEAVAMELELDADEMLEAFGQLPIATCTGKQDAAA